MKPWNYKGQIKLNCLTCGKEVMRSPSRLTLYKRTFCSHKCSGRMAKSWGAGKDFVKGHIPWDKDKKILQISNEKHPLWKGDDVSYGGLHYWITRKLGKPAECMYCGEDQRRLHWASISHKAKRDVDDYISLCVKCHSAYDRNAKKGGYYATN